MINYVDYLKAENSRSGGSPGRNAIPTSIASVKHAVILAHPILYVD